MSSPNARANPERDEHIRAAACRGAQRLDQCPTSNRHRRTSAVTSAAPWYGPRRWPERSFRPVFGRYRRRPRACGSSCVHPHRSRQPRPDSDRPLCSRWPTATQSGRLSTWCRQLRAEPARRRQQGATKSGSTPRTPAPWRFGHSNAGWAVRCTATCARIIVAAARRWAALPVSEAGWKSLGVAARNSAWLNTTRPVGRDKACARAVRRAASPVRASRLAGLGRRPSRPRCRGVRRGGR
jgi:hypothetical protein